MKASDVVPSTVHAWTEKIKTAFKQTVEGFFEVGDLLIAAKKALKHGEFRRMIEKDLPFSERTAQRLMAIAADKRLRKATHVSHLPPSWGTLYELTRLTDKQFEGGIKRGVINPEVSRSEIDAMRVVPKPPPTPKPIPDVTVIPTESETIPVSPDIPPPSPEPPDRLRLFGPNSSPSREQAAVIVRSWLAASYEAKRLFVVGRADEIRRIQKDIEAEEVAAQDRWTEGDQHR